MNKIASFLLSLLLLATLPGCSSTTGNMGSLSISSEPGKADIYIKLNQPENALNCYKKIGDEWSSDILADDALFKSAKIYDDLLGDDALALQLYNKILEDYNSSIFVAESRRRIRELTK